MGNSIIIPVYNEKSSLYDGKPYIEHMVPALKKTLSEGVVQRIDIINDGSCDGTGEFLTGLIEDFPNFRVWETGRAGKAKAILYGLTLQECKIDKVMFLDGDIIGYEPYVADMMFDELIGTRMVIARINQNRVYFDPLFSGVRSLYLQDLMRYISEPIVNEYFAYDDPVMGYGFEQLLNFHYWKEARLLDFPELNSRRAGGSAYGMDQICKAISWTTKVLESGIR